MKTFGLIGKSLSHSFSARYFNKKFYKEEITNTKYLNFEINHISKFTDLIKTQKNPSESEIKKWLEGNICRCTGYQNIVAAVKEASTKM